MERVIRNNLIIDKIEFVKEEVQRLCGRTVDCEKMIQFINEEGCTINYFDSVLKKTAPEEGYYAWLDSGYQTEKKETIFISLRRYEDYYSGYFVGTAVFLANGMCNRSWKDSTAIRNNIRKFNIRYEKEVEKRIMKNLMLESPKEVLCDNATIDTDALALKMMNSGLTSLESKEKDEKKTYIDKHEICESSSIAEEIFRDIKYSKWKSVNGLKRYLQVLGCRLQQLINQKKEQYYLHNKIGAVVNSGLIDKYGEYYMLYYKIHINHQGDAVYKLDSIIKNRQFYELNGFTSYSEMPKPISFFDDDNCVFKITKKELNTEMCNFNHIVSERNERFPENWQTESESKKADAIRTALLNGMKMQERDFSFVKPIYSTECKEISWLMPLHLNTDYPDEPELVMVIRKVGKFYEIKTILPYDDEIKDRITSVSPYGKLW